MKHQNISKGVESVILDSYMTSPNLSDFQKILNSLLSDNLKTIILNFENVLMIDSATIGYLFRIYKLSLQNDFKLKLVALNSKIYETLEIMGLERLFDFYDTQEDAINSIKYD
jgi:anti-anti-sigma factor